MPAHNELAARLSRPGVWCFTDGMAAGPAADFAHRIESLGYSALWIPDTVGRDPFVHAAFLGSVTSSLVLATGIASIFHRHPGAMVQASLTLAEQLPTRVLLGLGVSHRPIVERIRGIDYSKPLTQMGHYLDAMDDFRYRGPSPATAPRMLAALGPRMLALSAERADGAHPYWTTPDHTSYARAILGEHALLCVAQKVVLESDPRVARDTARAAFEPYASLPNYRRTWTQLGFSAAEIDARSDRLIDGLFAWGDESAVRARLQDHYDAGATHVCIEPIASTRPYGVDLHALQILAPAT